MWLCQTAFNRSCGRRWFSVVAHKMGHTRNKLTHHSHLVVFVFILPRNSLLSSSSPCSMAARFLFISCWDCFFLALPASFFFKSPWLCSFLLDWPSKSSKPAGEPALLLCDVFRGLELHWSLLRTRFLNVTISQHPKIASILLWNMLCFLCCQSVSCSTPLPLYISQLVIWFCSYTFPQSCWTLDKSSTLPRFSSMQFRPVTLSRHVSRKMAV